MAADSPGGLGMAFPRPLTFNWMVIVASLSKWCVHEKSVVGGCRPSPRVGRSQWGPDGLCKPRFPSPHALPTLSPQLVPLSLGLSMVGLRQRYRRRQALLAFFLPADAAATYSLLVRTVAGDVLHSLVLGDVARVAVLCCSRISQQGSFENAMIAAICNSLISQADVVDNIQK